MQLTLYFHPSSPPELEEVSFQRDGYPERVSSRGKSPFRGDTSGRFQWTSAVKAFALLAIGSRLAQMRAQGELYTISGEEQSPAASLDYAINKPTQWLLDVFGTDRDERPFATRVFQRFNSERKRPGPVKITLCSGILSNGGLTIYLGQNELTDPEALGELLTALKGEQPSSGSLVVPAQGDQIDDPDWRKSVWFEQALANEISDSLGETFLLESLGIAEISKRGEKLYAAEERKLLEGFRAEITAHMPSEALRYRAVNVEQLRAQFSREITVMCPPFAAGALALITFLKTVWNLPLSIDWSFPGTSAILSHTEQHEGNLALILSWNAAMKLRRDDGANDMSACTLLPRTRFDLVIPPVGGENCKSIFLAIEKNSYPSQHLEMLKTASVAGISTMMPENASLAECVTHLRRGSGAAVLAFPLSLVISKEIDGKILESRSAVPRVGDNILFLDQRMESRTRQALISAFTSGWFQLLENPALIRKVAQELAQHSPYTAFLQRIGGLYQQ